MGSKINQAFENPSLFLRLYSIIWFSPLTMHETVIVTVNYCCCLRNLWKSAGETMESLTLGSLTTPLPTSARALYMVSGGDCLLFSFTSASGARPQNNRSGPNNHQKINYNSFIWCQQRCQTTLKDVNNFEKLLDWVCPAQKYPVFCSEVWNTV